ncbi:MAG: AAA family ATPase [bacterium]|nr:AAA family ATPase [bacterium]
MPKTTAVRSDVFNSIIGYDNIKQELRLILDILQNPDKYKNNGCYCPKGLLLHGVPGVGKTLMADCLAQASGRPVFRCRKEQDSSNLISAIKNAFKEAAQSVPSIVYLDDMDKFANSDHKHRDNAEYVTVQSCIDEYRQNDIFVIATVNSLDSLPFSLYRSGRFDKVIKIELPKFNDAVSIIKYYMRNKPVKDLDYHLLARITQGHSCAGIETMLNTAAIKAGYQRADAITMEHIIEASMRCFYHISALETCSNEGDDCFDDNEDDDVYDNDDIDIIYKDFQNTKQTSEHVRMAAYHEAGHAILQEILFPESVNFISLTGKKNTLEGYLSIFNSENKNSIDWYLGQIIVFMGGRAAVELKLNTSSSPMFNDIAKARRCIAELRELGYYGFAFNSSFSEENFQKFRNIAIGHLEDSYGKAKKLLLQHTSYLDRLADHLIKHNIADYTVMQKLKKEIKEA